MKFEISLVVFTGMPNITTNHAITYTNFSHNKIIVYFCFSLWRAVCHFWLGFHGIKQSDISLSWLMMCWRWVCAKSLMKRRGVLTYLFCKTHTINRYQKAIFFPRRRKAEFQSSMNLVKGKVLVLSWINTLINKHTICDCILMIFI